MQGFGSGTRSADELSCARPWLRHARLAQNGHLSLAVVFIVHIIRDMYGIFLIRELTKKLKGTLMKETTTNFKTEDQVTESLQLQQQFDEKCMLQRH